MNSPRWNDDRLDDLARLVHTNDSRLDAVSTMVQAHDEDLTEMAKTGDRRQNNRFQMYMLLATIILGNFVNAILIITLSTPPTH